MPLDKRRFSTAMTIVTVTVAALQVIQVVQLTTLYNTQSGEDKVYVRKACVALALVIGASVVSRGVCASLWLFSKWNGKRFHEFYGGKIALLLTTAVSTYASAIAAGAVTFDMTVVPASRSLDPNFDALVGTIICTLALVAGETVFSHAFHITEHRGPRPSLLTNKTAVVFSVVAFLLFLAQLAVLGGQTSVFSALSNAEVNPALDEFSLYKADELLKAARGGLLLSYLNIGATAVLLLAYCVKSFWKDMDETVGGKVVLLGLSVSVWLVTSVSFGAVMPGASVLSVYDKTDSQLLVLKKMVSATSAIALTSLSFGLQMLAIVAVHIAAYLRVRAVENASPPPPPYTKGDTATK